MGKNPTRKEIAIFRYTIDVLNRREAWRGRWGAYISERMADYCGQCRRFKYCRRTHINEYIRRALWITKECPDLESIWERVLIGSTRSM